MWLAKSEVKPSNQSSFQDINSIGEHKYNDYEKRYSKRLIFTAYCRHPPPPTAEEVLCYQTRGIL